MEVTHLGCATVHQLIACFLLMHSWVDPVRLIARGIHRLSPEPSRSPVLIKHHPSHLTQGSAFPFHNTILRRRIWTRKLVFKTHVMAEGFKMRFLNSEPLSLRIARMASPCLSFLNLKTRSRTKPNVSLSPQQRKPTHTESSHPPQQGHTTSHPQIAHELGQQGPYGAARMDAQSSHR
jgi:hypothetical protein